MDARRRASSRLASFELGQLDGFFGEAELVRRDAADTLAFGDTVTSTPTEDSAEPPTDADDIPDDEPLARTKARLGL